MRLFYFFLALILFLAGCTTAEEKKQSCLEQKADAFCADYKGMLDSISNNQKYFRCLSEDRQEVRDYLFSARELSEC